MRSWLADRPVETVARPSYSPEDFGLTAAQIRDRFADYIERFDPI